MKNLLIMMTVLGILGLSACSSEYEQTLERELASGERHDSLFLGITLGMPAKDFYTHCWELNKQGIIRQGPSNLSVQYEINTLKDRVFMNFYPRFTNEEDRKIYEMPALFSYESWALWNPSYSSDSLLVELIPMLEGWFGGPFMMLTHPEKGSAYVRINGNRRVILSRKDEQYVKLDITDMTVPEKLKTQ